MAEARTPTKMDRDPGAKKATVEQSAGLIDDRNDVCGNWATTMHAIYILEEWGFAAVAERGLGQSG
ncbi:hypothetical protein [Natronoglycomyces albus]|uniref:Uncharacterized protein n=1 Tax=Natronoglycomyces albus TaxID=2811108 RepID=A0A895XU87_9ACTN|nr:hypothetical protein [Natronoglycomyces albus]QSB06859.1 hypothetical protein JQS30_08230 [Natronoglycomyces albus]